VLLDTCAALWVALDAPQLSARARELYEDEQNELYLSAVSVWEISLKNALGRLPLPTSPDVFVPDLRRRGRIETLPLDEVAALQIE
jgi:PIN domain nuclease of toxin-antitoxin system